ncbi:MAG: beta-N-acetylhexosaminidase [Polyangiaceae bacterium]|nr:beta-N-acetylhexosaminidase [Polyangiaceae bacterium]
MDPGALLVVGFPGTELPSAVAEDLRAGALGGVIVFKRNLPTLEAAQALAAAARAAVPSGPPPLLAIDQEGGRVVRLPPPAFRPPPMREVGDTGDPEVARRMGRAIGESVAAAGFNLDFAPVLDVDSNPANPIIGDRSFGRDPERVARMALALAEGLAEAGVLACGKHYPGHGDTHEDSHLALPRVELDAARLYAVELLPFREAASRGLESLMSAHVVYDALDPGVPATLSRRIASELLRGELGFRGVLFSDDLEMRALADRMEVEESAVRAVEAGCDALLVCSDLALAGRAREALRARARVDASFAARGAEACSRVAALRARAR